MQVRNLIIFIFSLFFVFSCQKDNLLTDPTAKLNFSEDTVLFDTVFTARGSATLAFKVYNPHKGAIKISSIRLSGGASSQFHLNIDGAPGFLATEVEIPGQDSIFIFAEVTIDPLNSNSPLVVSDQVIFETNGNVQSVELVAWGQDAHYFHPDQFFQGLPPFSLIAETGTQKTWINDKPYVIYGYAVVDSGASLFIQEGVKVHFHKNSGLWVYKGATIKVKGTKENPVIFQGDRLEAEYKESPGQWDRILINDGSIDNEIDYAIIKNGFIGIQTETLPPTALPSFIKITNTVIRNMSGIGLFSKLYSIYGHNNVITNCGQYGLALTLGGAYEFRHCSFANYWNLETRKTPNVFINNYNSVQAIDMDAYFGNCIIYGDQKTELGLDSSPDALFNFKLDFGLLKTEADISDPARYNQVIANSDPLFENISKFDLKLKSGSPAIDRGDPGIAGIVPYDIEGISRTTAPDLGAYEK